MVAITKENVGELSARLKINISSEDYQPLLKDSLKKLSKKVDLKGFRKGMVPVNVVKKMYGDQVLAEELNKLINKELSQYLSDNKIDILGSPLPTEEKDQEAININESKDYEFNYELGLSPELSLDILDKKTKLNWYQIKVEDKDLKSEIERLKKQLGTMTNPEAEVKEDDTIYVDLAELADDATNLKEGGVHNFVPIPVDMFSDKSLVEQILKLKLGESVQLNIFKSFDKEKEDIAKQLLNLDHKDIENLSGNFKMTLNKINRVEPAEVNQEFFDKVFGKDVVRSEQEFKDKLRAEIERIYERETTQKLHADSINLLIDQIKFELPDTFLKRWLVATNEKPIAPDELENEYANFTRSLRWNLILNKIKKDYDIDVNEEELKKHTKETIKAQFGLSESGMEEEQLEEWTKSILQNKEHIQKTYEQLINEKAFNLVKGKITVNRKEISLDKFKELN